jgi:transposase
MWCIPKASAAYVACMEDVLDLYEQPYDPKRPMVCFDEWRRALIGETRLGLPARPGKPQRFDYEYRRNGVAYLHMAFEPLTGKRYAQVLERHTMKDFAHCMKWLVDELYPQAEIIQVVLDNLPAHKPAALYVTFPPAEARRILKKLEFHFTPKHGSWLNMVEIELSVYSRSMKRHIPDRHIFEIETLALTEERNRSHSTVDWQFRCADARIKLKRLYPSVSQ